MLFILLNYILFFNNSYNNYYFYKRMLACLFKNVNTPTFNLNSNMRRFRIIAGGRSNHRGKRTKFRGGHARRSCPDIEDQQEDESTDTWRRQSSPFLYHQSTYSNPDRPISRARSFASRKSRESSTTQSRVSRKYIFLSTFINLKFLNIIYLCYIICVDYKVKYFFSYMHALQFM